MKTNTYHTVVKGDVAVAAVVFDLTKRGYIVSTPLTENSPYDLVCDVPAVSKVRIENNPDRRTNKIVWPTDEELKKLLEGIGLIFDVTSTINFKNGALGEIRTHDLSLRRGPLYPAELRAHMLL
jgi:hypothetical protein